MEREGWGEVGTLSLRVRERERGGGEEEENNVCDPLVKCLSYNLI